MMPKVFIGLALVAVIGGGSWYALSKKPAETPTVSGEEMEASERGTFADLMERIGSWKCVASAEHEGGASEGVVYMDRGTVRGDFVATISGRTVNTSFITLDGYIYTWSDLLPQGIKVKVDAAEGTAGGQGIDPSTEVEYSCEVWIAEAERFVLPEDIEFFEIGTQGMGGFQAPVPM